MSDKIDPPERQACPSIIDINNADVVKSRQKIQIVDLEVAAIKVSAHTARNHPEMQIVRVVESFKVFGCVLPLVVGKDNTLIAGHAMLAAAKRLKWTHVPAVFRADLSKADARALALTLNRLAELSNWNEEVLKFELKFLLDIEHELTFDVGVTGFGTVDFDRLFALPQSEADEAGGELNPSLPACCRSGDLWRLGRHRLLVGDATQAADFKTLCEADLAQLALTDPPYNVRIRGNVSGRANAREFAMASGEMSPAEFTGFLETVFKNLARHSLDGSIHMHFMDWRHQGEMLSAGHAAYDRLLNLCVWVKDNAGMGSLYRSQHEFCFVWKKGSAPHVNNVELGKHGRNRTNVWTYPGATTFRAGRKRELADHPTPKTVAMLVDAIKDCSDRKAIVVDCFLGSGSTLIACEKTGRRCLGMEIDPAYADAAIRRWEAFTGRQAVHIATGTTFSDLAEARAKPRVPEATPRVRQRLASAPTPSEHLTTSTDNGSTALPIRTRRLVQPNFKPGQPGNPNGRPRLAPTVLPIRARRRPEQSNDGENHGPEL